MRTWADDKQHRLGLVLVEAHFVKQLNILLHRLESAEPKISPIGLPAGDLILDPAKIRGDHTVCRQGGSRDTCGEGISA